MNIGEAMKRNSRERNIRRSKRKNEIEKKGGITEIQIDIIALIWKEICIL